MDYINKNAFYKELVHRHGKNYTYNKVCAAIDGEPVSSSDKEKKQMIAILREIIKQAEENILKS